MQRDVKIDYLKGILIVLMVYGHVTNLGHLQDLQNNVTSWIYTFHMPSFLVFSGYFFWKKLQRGGIALPLLKKLVIPYLIFEALYLLGLWGANSIGLPTSNPPPLTILGFFHTQLINPIGAFWFIHALIIIQLSFSVAVYITNSINRDGDVIWVISITLLGFATYAGIIVEWAVVYFFIGLLFSGMHVDLENPLIITILGGITCLILSWGDPIPFSVLQVAWVMSVISLVLHAAKLSPKPLVEFFAWLGRNTLIIVIAHPIFIVGLKPLANNFIAIDSSGLLNSGIAVIAATLGSIIFSRLFDMLGLSSLLFGTPQLYAPYNPSRYAR